MVDTVIFTTTFYGQNEEGRVRSDLARQFVRKSVDMGYPTVVVDGGTNDGKFLDELSSLGAHAYKETQRGLGNSRREALTHARKIADQMGKGYLLWSEPEKVSFLDSVPNLEAIISGDTEATLIVPSRANFDSAGYPSSQVHSESFGNQLHTNHGYVDINGRPLDTFFGPKIWHRGETPYFQVFGVEQEKVAETLAKMRLEQMSRQYGFTLHDDGSDPISQLELGRARKDLYRTDHMQHMPVQLMVLKNGTKFGGLQVEELRILSVPVHYSHPPEQTALELSPEYRATYDGKRQMQLNALAEQFALVQRLHRDGTLDETLGKMLSEEY